MKNAIASSFAAGFAALSLAACSTLSMPMGSGTNETVAEASTLAGTYLSANFAAATGDNARAATYFNGLLKQDPNNGDLLARAFFYAAQAGQIEQAVPLTGRILMQDDTNRPAHLVQQADALSRQDYTTAVALSGDTNGGGGAGTIAALTDPIVNAWARAGLRDYEGALSSLDKLTQQRGIDGLRLLHRALLLDYMGRTMEAEAAYRETFNGNGGGPRAADAYGRLLQRIGRSDDAKALYQRILRDNPGHPVATAALRDIAANKPALPLVANPAQGVAEALFSIAASLSDQRNANVSILYLNLTLYLRPDFDIARVLLANRYETLNKYENANTVYARIQASSPYYSMTQLQAGINDGRAGQNAAGIKRLQDLIKSEPEQPDIWTALGDLQRGIAKHDDAVYSYDKAVAGLRATDRRLVTLFFSRGISLSELGRWDDAEKSFRQALRINPDRAEILNYLGFSLVERGKNMDEAVTMLEKARALRPLDGPIADSAGWAYYRLGRYQDAVRTLEEAVQLAPGAADINDHLGDAYWRIGRKADARFQWIHALALEPDPKQKPAIERKLQFGLDAVAAER